MSQIPITCFIMGGLGNQLFQIFTLISTAIDQNKTFEFSYNESSQGSVFRPTYWSNFLSELIKYTSNDSNFMKKFLIYNESYHHYNEIPYFDKPVCIFGYFQSFKYFQNNIDRIKNIIKIDDLYLNLEPTLKTIIPISKVSISIHFRVGDYKNIQDCHPIMNLQYYIDALKHIFSKDLSINYHLLFFFEETDSDYVHNHFIFPIRNHKFYGGYKITTQNIDHNINDWSQLLIMSKCHHNIIANSSFSWWGAYLNNYEYRHICYPSKWFGPKLANKNTYDMFPPSWNKINC